MSTNRLEAPAPTPQSLALRESTRERLVSAARARLASGEEATPRLVEELCRDTGVRPASFRALFPGPEGLLDAVNDQLVEECASRLRLAVTDFVPTPGASGEAALVEAAAAMGAARPLDRSSLVIRQTRRSQALRLGVGSAGAAQAERRFVGALSDAFESLFAAQGRRFSWPPVLAVRIILDTYERSFEAWLLDGNAEGDFVNAPYISRSLPDLLARLSEPAGPAAPAEPKLAE
ncbi:hypothetical protein [Leucobacter sp. M11]|uniref:hypothetical protein n=1 Tax=Leucobacter sp. M11 TaxID=2993565 RepID=UPI002D7EE4CA|nr:hypothetical protein [Leucobacter sp. M11]MEB4615607.1 hypothetical protein [Leucobacter sp. M11]